MALFDYLKSTILSKIVMAVTGVLLVLYIIGHTLGNLQIYAGRDVFNSYAAALQGLGEGLWIIRIVLILVLVFHIITSVRLKLLNNSTKPTKYQVKQYVVAKLTSRTMFWTGVMIFAFLTYHLLHFTAGVTDPSIYGHVEHYGPQELFERHDVYWMVIQGFQQPVVSIVYIVGVILLGFHLSHAIQSMFQTLGFNHPKYNGFVRGLGPWLSTLIVLGLISIPISILFRLVGGDA
ncbi:MAG: succinate dehydrogenase cytochrome b subunit [Candidatus Kapaibacterium sp.]